MQERILDPSFLGFDQPAKPSPPRSSPPVRRLCRREAFSSLHLRSSWVIHSSPSDHCASLDDAKSANLGIGQTLTISPVHGGACRAVRRRGEALLERIGPNGTSAATWRLATQTSLRV